MTQGASGVNWNPWEPAAFDRARAEGKLVFLDISATWCHWCHVLDRTSLSDERVVALLNESFVPVRVDTDRRPDINDRYNQGGWPTTAVLLPNGQLLTGATYLPPDSLLEVLSRCVDFYRKERAQVDRYMVETASRPAVAAVEAPPPEGPGPADLSLVKHSVLAHYDPVHPGFFREPKFLVTEILSFLSDAWLLEGNREMGDTLLAILRRMGASGVCDAVEGGFFRYATRRDWTVPHYEKLLSDNAEMLSLYAAAYGRTGEEAFARTSEGILGFLFRTLHDPATAAFFSSQDADEDYYPLPSEERARRAPPAVDRTLYSEYNAKAVSALVAAHRAFGGGGTGGPAGDSLLARAERLGRFLRERSWSEGEGQARFSGGGSDGSGLLVDNVAAATAHLDLWSGTGKKEFLGFAGEALDWTVRHLYSAKNYGFLDRRPREEDFGTLSVPLVPFPANARAACALIRYAREAARPDLFAVAEQTIRGLSAEYDKRAAFGAPYGSALLLHRAAGGGEACLPGDPSCAPDRSAGGGGPTRSR